MPINPPQPDWISSYNNLNQLVFLHHPTTRVTGFNPPANVAALLGDSLKVNPASQYASASAYPSSHKLKATGKGMTWSHPLNFGEVPGPAPRVLALQPALRQQLRPGPGQPVERPLRRQPGPAARRRRLEFHPARGCGLPGAQPHLLPLAPPGSPPPGPGTGQPVPLNTVAREALIERARFRATWCPDSPWVFTRRDGTRIESIKTSFAAACVKAGISDCHPHDLRRTCGSWLIQGGTDIAKVARILRHADVRVTAKVYAHLRTEDLEDDLEAIAKRGNRGNASHERITQAK